MGFRGTISILRSWWAGIGMVGQDSLVAGESQATLGGLEGYLCGYLRSHRCRAPRDYRHPTKIVERRVGRRRKPIAGLCPGQLTVNAYGAGSILSQHCIALVAIGPVGGNENCSKSMFTLYLGPCPSAKACGVTATGCLSC